MASPSQAEKLPLNLGSLGQKAEHFEIAFDPGFSRALVTTELGQKANFVIDFPVTGIYYLRVFAMNKIIWQEAFFVFLGPSEASYLPKLTWRPLPQAISFRLWVYNLKGAHLLQETPDNIAVLASIGTPCLMRWRVHLDNGRQQSLGELSLTWVKSLSSKVEAKQAVTQNKFFDEDQSSNEPDDTDLLKEAGSTASDSLENVSEQLATKPIARFHQLYSWLRFFREKSTIDKQDRFAAPSTPGAGIGLAGQFFARHNLSIFAALDTHGTQTYYENGGVETPASTQKRLRAHLALGLDVLNTNTRNDNLALNLGPVWGLVQIPLVRDNQALQDYGLMLNLQMFKPSLSFEALLLKSSSREFTLSSFLPWHILGCKPFVGIYRFFTYQSSGAVNANFLENGIRLGLGREF